jgi:glycerate-2-kinase
MTEKVIKAETPQEAHAAAVTEFTIITGKHPVPDPKPAKTGTPFLASLVGANAE